MTATAQHTQLTLQNSVLRRYVSADQGQRLRYYTRPAQRISLGFARSSLHAGSDLCASPHDSPCCIPVNVGSRDGANHQFIVLAGVHDTLPEHQRGRSAGNTRYCRASGWCGTTLPGKSAGLCRSGEGQVIDIFDEAAVDKCSSVRRKLSRPRSSFDGCRASGKDLIFSSQRSCSDTPRRQPSRDSEDVNTFRDKRSQSWGSRASCLLSSRSLSPRCVHMDGYLVTRDSEASAAVVPFGYDISVPASGVSPVQVVTPVVAKPETEVDVVSSRAHPPRQDSAPQTDYVWSWERRPPPPESVEPPTLQRDISIGAATLLSLTNPSALPASVAVAQGSALPLVQGTGRSGPGEGSVLTNVRAMCESIELARALASVYYTSDKPLVMSSFHRHPEVVSVLEDLRQMRTVLVDSVERLQLQELEEALQVACMRSLEEEANAGGEVEAAELAMKRQLALNKDSEGGSSALAGAGAFVVEAASKLGGCIRQATSELLGIDRSSKAPKPSSSGSETDSATSARNENRSSLSTDHSVSKFSSCWSATADSSLQSTREPRTTTLQSSRGSGSSASAGSEDKNVLMLEAIDELRENDPGLPRESRRLPAGTRIDPAAPPTPPVNGKEDRVLGRRQQPRTIRGRHDRRGRMFGGGKTRTAETDFETASFAALTPDQSIAEPLSRKGNSRSLLGGMKRGRSMPETGSRASASRQEAAPPPPPLVVAPGVYVVGEASDRRHAHWRNWGRRWSHSGVRIDDKSGAAKAFQDFRTLEAARQLGSELAVTAAGNAAAAAAGAAARDAESQAPRWHFRRGSRRKSSSGTRSTQGRCDAVGATPLLSVPQSGQAISTTPGQQLTPSIEAPVDCSTGMAGGAARHVPSGVWVETFAPTDEPGISSLHSLAAKRDSSGPLELILLRPIPGRPRSASHTQGGAVSASGKTGGKPSISGRDPQTTRQSRSRWLTFRLRKRHRKSGIANVDGVAESNSVQTREFKYQSEPRASRNGRNETRSLSREADTGNERKDYGLEVSKNRKAGAWFRHAFSMSKHRVNKDAGNIDADQERTKHADSLMSCLTMPEETTSAMRTGSLLSRESMTSRSHEEEDRERHSDLSSGIETLTSNSGDYRSSANRLSHGMWLTRKLSSLRSRKGGKNHSPHQDDCVARAIETS
ncbi:hypothetical protein TGME49_212900 [Toxoplasma gondii ME49]|uniref:Uncharacterized protein n=1 Tax=Toxoplasma gondii (strain ATCC 50611 / Me49) TaxID=508771 RepID=S8F5R7_TOXGM|nr:hypothetical protein TGME49_212900 [Toxoplasma gondii ME49]EPT31186.1 hypothetical protein TGME49_212900 [Toxoplasma gondii ME49]|eukprot:XP_018637863.1 hypothetical protein TGME49_212900 [Toxoplasma gondii ME49]